MRLSPPALALAAAAALACQPAESPQPSPEPQSALPTPEERAELATRPGRVPAPEETPPGRGESAVEGTLVVLGPVGEWLVPRDPSILDSGTASAAQTYLANLEALLEEHGPADVVALGPVGSPLGNPSPDADQRVRAFLASADVQAILPSPADLAFGSSMLNTQALRYEAPPLLSDAEFALAGAETNYRVGLLRLSGADATLAYTAPVRALDLILGLAGSYQTGAGADRGTVNLRWEEPLASLGPGQALVWSIGQGEPVATVDLLDPASPLLQQPAAVALTIGEEITPQIAEGRILPLTDSDAHTAERLPIAEFPGLADRADNTEVHLMHFSTGGQRTHTALRVSADPGDFSLGVSYIILVPAGGEDYELIWLRSPIFGGHPTRFSEVIAALRADLPPGSAALPPDPPEVLGAERSYRAFVESLQAALPLVLAPQVD